MVLCNGPGTCVPIVLISYLLTKLGLRRTRVMYVESVARVTSLSMSGRLVYGIVDCFMVQWPQLLQKYPKAVYKGRLV
jgi:beta-1,4-N-acetylglucosaminyltransferase